MQAAFTEDDLVRLAGTRSYTRGQGYTGAVTRLRRDGDGTVTALVSGTEVYEVALWLTGEDGPDGECDCPYGRQGHFCKHCVAVGLVLLDGAQFQGVPAQRGGSVLREWLAALTREQLCALVEERLGRDREWRRALELRAEVAQAARGGSGAGDQAGAAGGVRARILELVDAGRFSRDGFVGYADAHAFGDQVTEAVGALRTLTGAGRAERAVVVAREAIETVLRGYECVDDSSGYVGGAVNDLADAHLEACRACRPDPGETGRWLAGRILHDDYGTPAWDLEAYHDVLGPAGLAEVRRLAEEAYAHRPSGWAEKQLLESLHQAAHDVDALVDLYAQDLAPGGWTHLRIARTLDTAGRPAQALEWAGRGLRTATGEQHVHDELVDYLARRYADAGRQADTVTLRRDRFRAELTLSAYRKLRTAASHAGCWDSGEGERTTALGLLRTAAAAHRHTPGPHPAGSRHSSHDALHMPRQGHALIDVLIDENELDEAWEAADGLASAHQWLALADASTATRPADAARVYLHEVAARKHHTGDSNYLEIARLLVKARACHERLGTQTDFTHYITQLRTEQKRKRNLMKTLDRHQL